MVVVQYMIDTRAKFGGANNTNFGFGGLAGYGRIRQPFPPYQFNPTLNITLRRWTHKVILWLVGKEFELNAQVAGSTHNSSPWFDLTLATCLALRLARAVF